MFEIIKSGGWMMLPIILSSVIALAIIIERFWTLQRNKIIPPELLGQVRKLHLKNVLIFLRCTD